ncbi:MAG: FAD-dependent oxidoreductase [Lachnospiraceae bacterium]|nr:FAD-dependent oxidoreductase [Lachnospiraceae bacterium]
MLTINQLKINTDKIIGQENELKIIKKALSEKIKTDGGLISDLRILKKSLDARKKPELNYIYTVCFKVPDKHRDRLLKNSKLNISEYKPAIYKYPEISKENAEVSLRKYGRPVIIGSGPAGYMCGYMLAKAGLKPIIIERGYDVDTRTGHINDFWNNDKLMTDSNIQFGEGGAGTFSDGKLQTGVSDKYGRISEILKIYVKNGAPEVILFNSKPHIGSDYLTKMVKNMRKSIEEMGGEIRFNTLFKGIYIKQLSLTESVIEKISLQNLLTNEEYFLQARYLVIATGHSARDTYRMLDDAGLKMKSKPFAVGFRVQHRQSMINMSQYGKDDDNLPSADYKLIYTAPSGKSVYSFCMCPGGYVVNASSEPGYLAVNGMSNHGRDGLNANSAIVISVDEKDYGDGLFDGMKFQETIEQRAFDVNSGKITVQKLIDFKNNIPSMNNGTPDNTGEITPEIKGRYTYGNLRSILPENLNFDIIGAFDDFGHKIKGFDDDKVLLCGIESRTSAPLRILRDNDTLMADTDGIYPCGEGAGYAGGITSAALDGIKVAEKIVTRYKL